MTEKQLRNQFAKTAESYWGCKESDGSHKKIIDLYNTQKELPRNYAVKPTDEWCATYVSAMAVQLDMLSIVFPECSCNKMIELYKAAGRWQEKDDYTPQVGDIVMYDWDDDGKDDNVGVADHVGVVVHISAKTITVIEGNKNKAVDYRDLQVDGKNIRGYCLPDFASVSEDAKPAVCTVTVPVLKTGVKSDTVKAMQMLLTGWGFSCGEKAADGSFGQATENALKAYQKAMGLSVDGVCGPKTWAKLLGVN